ncbi:prepilin peptidase, partial [Patescibacteria group bacterium]|nr:prepilin peptidase [Patescibacteria group bacterium]
MLIYFFIFLFGLSVGSFLNVVIFRLEKDKLILSGRSKCPKCKTVLKWHDLIPVLSFIFTWGRCRYCQKKISWQYPMVEIFTGIIFLLIFKQFSLPAGEAGILNFQTLELFYYFIIVSFLIIIFVYDLRHYLIPDKIVFPAIVIAVIFNLQFLISKQF